jgi:methylated-DNA-[protein]-cysteine S-methyltransferase
MQPSFYVPFHTVFGTCSIVWQESAKDPQVLRIFLPSEKIWMKKMVRAAFPDVQPGITPVIENLCEQIRAFLKGEAIEFDLNLMALENCSEFQQKVLIAEHRIPRGWVSTYDRIAGKVGVTGGARAVGRALATNPFPIIIPCHRAIQSAGGLGGYQGGLKMKRTLLAYEGIEFSASDKVLMKNMYY